MIVASQRSWAAVHDVLPAYVMPLRSSSATVNRALACEAGLPSDTSASAGEPSQAVEPGGSGRPQPVGLEIAHDVLAATGDVSLIDPPHGQSVLAFDRSVPALVLNAPPFDRIVQRLVDEAATRALEPAGFAI